MKAQPLKRKETVKKNPDERADADNIPEY